MKKQR
jgi:hypothetical protein